MPIIISGWLLSDRRPSACVTHHVIDKIIVFATKKQNVWYPTITRFAKPSCVEWLVTKFTSCVFMDASIRRRFFRIAACTMNNFASCLDQNMTQRLPSNWLQPTTFWNGLHSSACYVPDESRVSFNVIIMFVIRKMPPAEVTCSALRKQLSQPNHITVIKHLENDKLHTTLQIT